MAGQITSLDDLKDDGNLAFKSGDWLRAVMRYSEAIMLDGPATTRSIIYSNRAAALLLLNAAALALEDCDRALELDQTNKKRASAKEAVADKIGAIEDLELLLALDPVDFSSVRARLRELRQPANVASPQAEASTSQPLSPKIAAAPGANGAARPSKAKQSAQPASEQFEAAPARDAKGKGREVIAEAPAHDNESVGKSKRSKHGKNAQTAALEPPAASPPMSSRSNSTSSAPVPADVTPGLQLRAAHDRLRTVWDRSKDELTARWLSLGKNKREQIVKAAQRGLPNFSLLPELRELAKAYGLHFIAFRAMTTPADAAHRSDLVLALKIDHKSQPAPPNLYYFSLRESTYGAIVSAKSDAELKDLIERREACTERVGRSLAKRQCDLLELCNRLVDALLTFEPPTTAQPTYDAWAQQAGTNRYSSRPPFSIDALASTVRAARAAAEDHVAALQTDVHYLCDAIKTRTARNKSMNEDAHLAVAKAQASEIILGALYRRSVWREASNLLSQLASVTEEAKRTRIWQIGQLINENLRLTHLDLQRAVDHSSAPSNGPPEPYRHFLAQCKPAARGGQSQEAGVLALFRTLVTIHPLSSIDAIWQARQCAHELGRFFEQTPDLAERIGSWLLTTFLHYVEALRIRDQIYDAHRPVLAQKTKDALPKLLATWPTLRDRMLRCWRDAELDSSVVVILRSQSREAFASLWRKFDHTVRRVQRKGVDELFDAALSQRVAPLTPRWVGVDQETEHIEEPIDAQFESEDEGSFDAIFADEPSPRTNDTLVDGFDDYDDLRRARARPKQSNGVKRKGKGKQPARRPPTQLKALEPNFALRDQHVIETARTIFDDDKPPCALPWTSFVAFMQAIGFTTESAPGLGVRFVRLPGDHDCNDAIIFLRPIDGSYKPSQVPQIRRRLSSLYGFSLRSFDTL